MLKYASQLCMEAIVIGTIIALLVPISAGGLNMLFEGSGIIGYPESTEAYQNLMLLAFTSAFLGHILCEVTGLNCRYLTKSVAAKTCGRNY